jgi:hypothetical protein
MEIDNALISMGISIFALVAGFFYFQNNQRNFEAGQDENRRKDQQAYNDRIIRLETQMDIFLKGISSQAPGILMKGNPISMDSRLYKLMEKFTTRTIEENERCELILELERESRNDEHTAGERISMSIWAASQRALMLPVEERKCKNGFVPADCI